MLLWHKWVYFFYVFASSSTSKLPTGAGGLTAAFSGADFLTLTGAGASAVFFDFALKKILQDSEEDFVEHFLGQEKKMDCQSVKRSQGMAKMGL